MVDHATDVSHVGRHDRRAHPESLEYDVGRSFAVRGQGQDVHVFEERGHIRANPQKVRPARWQARGQQVPAVATELVSDQHEMRGGPAAEEFAAGMHEQVEVLDRVVLADIADDLRAGGQSQLAPQDGRIGNAAQEIEVDPVGHDRDAAGGGAEVAADELRPPMGIDQRHPAAAEHGAVDHALHPRRTHHGAAHGRQHPAA